MSDTATETRSVIVEREVPFPPERLWRALTQPHLIAEWLMQNDFAPVVGHAFQLRGDWGHADCKVLEVEPPTSLAYTWDAMGLESKVTFTLTRTPSGTHLRMEQAGFPASNKQALGGALWGWQKFLGNLEEVVARLD
jgi:uncharacterized protein YndB with AHSA1/START domain